MSASTPVSLFLDQLLSRSQLDADERALVASLPYKVRTLPSTTDFLAIGENVHHSTIVVEGYCCRFGQSKSGTRQITSIYMRGNMPDLFSAMLPNLAYGMQTLGPATIAEVPHEAILHASNYPAIARAFWRDCIADAALAVEWVINLGAREALSRVAHLVCEIAERRGLTNATEAFKVPLTQQQLGEATGISAVHVNRVLRELRERGIMTIQHGLAHVLDWTLLKEVGDFDRRYLHLGESGSQAN